MSSPAVFRRSPLFAQLTEGQLARLAGLAVPRRYGKDQVIFQEGDPGTALYVIVEGRVRIARSSPDGRERTIILLGPGDFFGELALLDGGARSEDAIVHEDSELLLVPREDFLAFLLEQPQVAMSLLVALSQRLRRTSQLVNDAAFFDVRARLARVRAGHVPGGRSERPSPRPSRGVRVVDRAGKRSGRGLPGRGHGRQ